MRFFVAFCIVLIGLAGAGDAALSSWRDPKRLQPHDLYHFMAFWSASWYSLKPNKPTLLNEVSKTWQDIRVKHPDLADLPGFFGSIIWNLDPVVRDRLCIMAGRLPSYTFFAMKDNKMFPVFRLPTTFDEIYNFSEFVLDELLDAHYLYTGQTINADGFDQRDWEGRTPLFDMIELDLRRIETTLPKLQPFGEEDPHKFTILLPESDANFVIRPFCIDDMDTGDEESLTLRQVLSRSFSDLSWMDRRSIDDALPTPSVEPGRLCSHGAGLVARAKSKLPSLSIVSKIFGRRRTTDAISPPPSPISKAAASAKRPVTKSPVNAPKSSSSSQSARFSSSSRSPQSQSAAGKAASTRARGITPNATPDRSPKQAVLKPKPSKPVSSSRSPSLPASTSRSPKLPASSTRSPSHPVSTSRSPQPSASTSRSAQPPASTSHSPQPSALTSRSRQPPASTSHSPQPPALTSRSRQPPVSTSHSPHPPALTSRSRQPPASTSRSAQPPVSTSHSPQPPASTSRSPQLPASNFRTPPLSGHWSAPSSTKPSPSRSMPTTRTPKLSAAVGAKSERFERRPSIFEIVSDGEPEPKGSGVDLTNEFKTLPKFMALVSSSFMVDLTKNAKWSRRKRSLGEELIKPIFQPLADAGALGFIEDRMDLHIYPFFAKFAQENRQMFLGRSLIAFTPAKDFKPFAVFPVLRMPQNRAEIEYFELFLWNEMQAIADTYIPSFHFADTNDVYDRFKDLVEVLNFVPQWNENEFVMSEELTVKNDGVLSQFGASTPIRVLLKKKEKFAQNVQ